MSLAGLERQLARAWPARVAGQRAEVARLEESIAAEQRSGLPASRTDAIVAVLSRGRRPDVAGRGHRGAERRWPRRRAAVGDRDAQPPAEEQAG
ncbi:MAG: hypothetical protein V9E94_20930 [Microthrixaceae bacterium]